MALEDTLEELTERRVAFKAFREDVDRRMREWRLEQLSAEQASIEHIIVRAMAEGATLGQIKRAYGTKDHRTITDIVTARQAEISALIQSRLTEKAKTNNWFEITDDGVIVTVGKSKALFTYVYVDGEPMFTTEEPLWNDDFTIKNEAVELLDGKTPNDSDEAAVVARAISES